jgi:Transglycosylase SLT domain
MNRIPTLVRLFLLCSIVGLCSTQVFSQTRRLNKRNSVSTPNVDSQIKSGQTRLKLTDGTFIVVDDAWETAQGIWYKQGGISHLASRDRVKAIERGTQAEEKGEPETPKPLVATAAQTGVFDKPAWIYLKGGARFEADSARESPAGVWYKRGPLSIFIEHSRIDHIEAEEAEKVAESSGKKERGFSTGSQKLDGLIRQNGSRYGVDPYLIFLVMEQESHFNPRVVSPKGAQGLMQLMPGTSARFGVRRPNDPAQNISGGTRYLKQLLDRFNNRVDLALASYNAGEGAVIKFGHKVPPYRETREYVKRISYRYRRSAEPAKAKVAAAVPGAAGGR